jgi:adenylate cyclase
MIAQFPLSPIHFVGNKQPMSTQSVDGCQPDLAEVLDWLVAGALSDKGATALFAELCERLTATGLPLQRAHLAMRTLHPLVDSVDLTWWRGEELVVTPRPHRTAPVEAWLQSPLYWMLQHKRTELRQHLNDTEALERFPVLREFAECGATDYIAALTPFGDPDTAFERQDGILTSWITDAAGGFSAADVTALRRVWPYVGLVAKLAKHEQTAQNVVSAYLGADAGARVLAGQIRLGDVERIPAVIWYSDLRDSTAMADRMPVNLFLKSLNAYFECAAGAVLDQGGEVLRFIGDAVLAVFPVGGDKADAAVRAYAASRAAQQRLIELNDSRASQGVEPLAFGLALHVGEVLYGNIGVPSRIEFSVIGGAANEVCRIEGLTKTSGEPLLVSREFRDALPLPYRDLGSHTLKGVGKPVQVFAPPSDQGD